MVSGLSIGVFVIVFGIGLYGYAVVTDESTELRRAVLASTIGFASTALGSGIVPAPGGETIERLVLVGTVLGYGLGFIICWNTTTPTRTCYPGEC